MPSTSERINVTQTSSQPLADGREMKSELSIEGPADHMMIILDKYAREQSVDETPDGGTRPRQENYPYPDAGEFMERFHNARGAGGSVGNASGSGAGGADADATGLDDTIQGGIDEAKDALRKTKVTATSAADPDTGKRNLEVSVVYDGEEVVSFDATDLDRLDDLADATGLDEDAGDASEPAGGEVVRQVGSDLVPAEGAHPEPRPWKGLQTKFQATSNGENDRVDNEVTNVLTQLNSGFIMLIGGNVNVNVGVEAGVYIFIA